MYIVRCFCGMDISCPNWDLGIIDKKTVSDHPHIQFVDICDCLSQAS